MRQAKQLSGALATIPVLLLAACGGGGGGQPKPPLPRAPLQSFKVELAPGLEPWRASFEASMAGLVPKINDYLAAQSPLGFTPRTIIARFRNEWACGETTSYRFHTGFSAPIAAVDCSAKPRVFAAPGGQWGANGTAFELTMMLVECDKCKGGFCGGPADDDGKFRCPASQGLYNLIIQHEWVGEVPKQ